MIHELRPESPEEALEHFGVKGMHWGQRSADSSNSESSSDPRSKMKKGAIVAASVLAVAGGVAVAVAVHKSNQNKAAQKAVNEMLKVPFKWRKGTGPWQTFVKDANGVWNTRP